MFFEAESNDTKYEVNVNETRNTWTVSIKTEGQDWINYEIPKADYQRADDTISLIFNNSSYLVDVVGHDTDYTVYTRGSFRNIRIYNEEKLLHESLKKGGDFGGGASLDSGMPGKIVKILCEEGEEVAADSPLIIMEAMKMENEMRAPRDVKIKSIHVKEGANVEAGTVLISFES
ncbi:MAG: acetyl-CoA carboxylase biotin carboxyl carrier protein subunit [Bdellovibrionales bacterium]|nr:acetyl-CoA carboxylase biotin carboxyl carrier protein subunit [Bdellovibrionales bacterium]